MPKKQEKLQLEVGKDDVAIILSPTEAASGEYAVQLSIPNHLEDRLEKNDEDVPPYVLVAFQLCQYISNPDNMMKIDQYFQEQMDKSMKEMAEEEEKNGIIN